MLYHMLKGLIKLTQKCKNPRKSRIGQSPPTHPHIQFLFFGGIMYNNKKPHRNHKKTQFTSKNYQNELGFDPPTHFRVFPRFLDFLT